MSLVNDIKAIQRHVGAEPDGVFGPITAGRVLADLQNAGQGKAFGWQLDETALDERTLTNLATLDAKAQERFRDFLLAAKATAATFGCDYVAISGHRTWEEQDALYARGRTKPGQKVTNAKGGQSNHNFAVAIDCGVFQGKVYLDGGDPRQASLANKVHEACAVHARQLGIDWGGDWSGPKDYPHFDIRTGLTLAQKRKAYNARGSVL